MSKSKNKSSTTSFDATTDKDLQKSMDHIVSPQRRALEETSTTISFDAPSYPEMQKAIETSLETINSQQRAKEAATTIGEGVVAKAKRQLEVQKQQKAVSEKNQEEWVDDPNLSSFYFAPSPPHSGNVKETPQPPSTPERTDYGAKLQQSLQQLRVTTANAKTIVDYLSNHLKDAINPKNANMERDQSRIFEVMDSLYNFPHTNKDLAELHEALGGFVEDRIGHTKDPAAGRMAFQIRLGLDVRHANRKEQLNRNVGVDTPFSPLEQQIKEINTSLSPSGERKWKKAQAKLAELDKESAVEAKGSKKGFASKFKSAVKSLISGSNGVGVKKNTKKTVHLPGGHGGSSRA